MTFDLETARLAYRAVAGALHNEDRSVTIDGRLWIELLGHMKLALDEIDRLNTRQQELLAAMVRVSNETPFADEAKDALAQRGKLVAEVGTLRSQLAAAQQEIETHRQTLDEKLGAWQVSVELGRARWEARRLHEQLAAAQQEIEKQKSATRAAWAAQHHALDLAHRRAVQLEMLAGARDEACDVAESEALDETWSKAAVNRTLARIAELRAVGRDGETNHGGDLK